MGVGNGKKLLQGRGLNVNVIDRAVLKRFKAIIEDGHQDKRKKVRRRNVDVRGVRTKSESKARTSVDEDESGDLLEGSGTNSK